MESWRSAGTSTLENCYSKVGGAHINIKYNQHLHMSVLEVPIFYILICYVLSQPFH